MPASPFQASGETSPGKNDDLPRTIAGSTPLPLGRRSFAVSGPLAPVRSASYPVPVRRLTGSFHASFSVRLTTNALRFPSVPATRFREDFHLQVIAHAGPTTGLRRKGRVHDQAVCAVANKLAGRAYALMKRMSQGQDARYVYRDLQGRPIAKEEARCRVQNEFPGPTAIRRMEAARSDASPTTPSNKARRTSPAYARPPGSDASSSGYRTPRHISKILAELALAELLASSGQVNDE